MKMFHQKIHNSRDSLNVPLLVVKRKKRASTSEDKQSDKNLERILEVNRDYLPISF